MMIDSRKSYRNSRSEFEKDINHLIESIRNGKIMVPQGFADSKNGIFKVRFSPNKRLNLNTVNESVRAMAMRRITKNFIKEGLNGRTGNSKKHK